MEPEDLLNRHSVGKQYVYLVAKSDDGHFKFEKEAKILLSYQDILVYIQTDKPIYTSRQNGKNSTPDRLLTVFSYLKRCSMFIDMKLIMLIMS